MTISIEEKSLNSNSAKPYEEYKQSKLCVKQLNIIPYVGPVKPGEMRLSFVVKVRLI